MARVENTMRDVYSVSVCQVRGLKGVFSFHSHKNDSLKSLRQLASGQSVGVEGGSYIVDIKKKKKIWSSKRKGYKFFEVR